VRRRNRRKLTEEKIKFAAQEWRTTFDSINLVKLKCPDFTILDPLMPDMDDVEVAKKLKGDLVIRNIRVIS